MICHCQSHWSIDYTSFKLISLGSCSVQCLAIRFAQRNFLNTCLVLLEKIRNLIAGKMPIRHPMSHGRLPPPVMSGWAQNRFHSLGALFWDPWGGFCVNETTKLRKPRLPRGTINICQRSRKNFVLQTKLQDTVNLGQNSNMWWSRALRDSIIAYYRPVWAQVKGHAIDVPTMHYRAILHSRHINSTSIAR